MMRRISGVAVMAAALGAMLVTAPCLAQVVWSAPPVAAVEPTEPPQLSDDQIEQLLEPIALYPDPLLAQILPASTYPLEVVEAFQWLQNNPSPSDMDIDAQPWDASVKALLRYPEVLKMMAENVQWTQSLGAAFLYQQDDTTAAIQRLRRQAVDSQNLPMDTPEQHVVVQQTVIEILPADPAVIYVPDYDPQVVYVRQARRPTFGFIRHPIGGWLNIGFDWGRRSVVFGAGWHPGWDRDGRNWRRRELPVADPVIRTWSHDRVKPRPQLPPALVRHVQVSRRPEGDHRPAVLRTEARHDLPVIPRVGPMRRFDRQGDARGRDVHAPTVLEQTASETRRAQERFRQDRPQGPTPPLVARDRTPVPAGHDRSTPPRRTSSLEPSKKFVKDSRPGPGAFGTPTSPADTRDQSDRGHRSMKKH